MFIIATPIISYFVFGMLALLLTGVHWSYGLPLFGYIMWRVHREPNLAKSFISGFVFMALFLSPAIIMYVHTAGIMWGTVIKVIFGG